MKYMNNSRTNNNTAGYPVKKKKTFNHNDKSAFARIFNSTTILSRSPSHSFKPAVTHLQSKMAHNINKPVANNFQINQTNPAFKNYRYKKSKSIKINNSNNSFQHPNNNNNLNSQHIHQQQNNRHNYNFNNYYDSVANHLANMFHSELTINLTKHEPRMVLFNNPNNYSQNYSQSLSATSVNNNKKNRKIFQQHNSLTPSNGHKKHSKSFKMNQQQLVPQSVGSGPAKNPQYRNRFKYIKKNNPRTHAPYNTTQYIMHDYSKRRSHDQECTNEQQQFSADWNMALANGTTGTTESLNKIANINKTLINTNALISLSKLEDELNLEDVVISSSLGSSLNSNSSELNERLDNIAAKDLVQLSSSF